MAEGTNVGDAVLKFTADYTDLDKAQARVGQTVSKSTEQASSGLATLDKYVEKSGEGFEEFGERSTKSVDRGRNSVDLLAHQFGIAIPRELKKVIAESELAGQALDTAFKAVAFIAILELAVKIGQAISEWASNTFIYTEAMKAAYAQQVALNELYTKAADDRKTADEQYYQATLTNIQNLERKQDELRIKEVTAQAEIRRLRDEAFFAEGTKKQQLLDQAVLVEKQMANLQIEEATNFATLSAAKVAQADKETKEREQLEQHLYQSLMSLWTRLAEEHKALEAKTAEDIVRQYEESWAQMDIGQSLAGFGQMQQYLGTVDKSLGKMDDVIIKLSKDLQHTAAPQLSKWGKTAQDMAHAGAAAWMQMAFAYGQGAVTITQAARQVAGAVFMAAVKPLTDMATLKMTTELAEGFSALGHYDFASAGHHFASAALWGTVGGIAQMAGGAITGSGNGMAAGSTGFSAGSGGGGFGTPSQANQAQQTPVQAVNLQHFAKGALLMGPMVAELGEGGKREMVLPLEDPEAMASLRAALGMEAGPKVHITNHFAGSLVDHGNLMRELSRQVKKGGKLQASDSFRQVRRA